MLRAEEEEEENAHSGNEKRRPRLRVRVFVCARSTTLVCPISNGNFPSLSFFLYARLKKEESIGLLLGELLLRTYVRIDKGFCALNISYSLIMLVAMLSVAVFFGTEDCFSERGC